MKKREAMAVGGTAALSLLAVVTGALMLSEGTRGIVVGAATIAAGIYAGYAALRTAHVLRNAATMGMRERQTDRCIRSFVIVLCIWGGGMWALTWPTPSGNSTNPNLHLRDRGRHGW